MTTRKPTAARRMVRCMLCCLRWNTATHIDRRGTARASMIIACQDCGCRVESGDVYGLTPPELYQWNERAIQRGAGE